MGLETEFMEACNTLYFGLIVSTYPLPLFINSAYATDGSRLRLPSGELPEWQPAVLQCALNNGIISRLKETVSGGGVQLTFGSALSYVQEQYTDKKTIRYIVLILLINKHEWNIIHDLGR